MAAAAFRRKTDVRLALLKHADHGEIAGNAAAGLRDDPAAFDEDAIVRWSFVDKQAGDDEVISSFGPGAGGGGSVPNNIGSDCHALQIANLAAAITSGEKLLVDGAEGRRAVEFICGIYDSVRSGKPHLFPENGR